MNSRQIEFQAIGTQWQIKIGQAMPDAAWKKLILQIDRRIAAFDKNYSRFRPDSLVTKMAQKAGEYQLPTDGHNLLHFYKRLYDATDGKVTPLIGQVISDAGYDADYSFDAKNLSQPSPWEEILSYDGRRIVLKRPALLDFGAAGKGYLVDIVATLLHDAGITSFMINAGGDIAHYSKSDQPLKVGLENPTDTSEVLGIAKLHNQSLCASAGNKRSWGDYHHIIDPQTLQSPRAIIATWVIADDTMTADGLATALFFQSPKKLGQDFSFEYAMLDEQMVMTRSQGFSAQLFTPNKVTS